MISIVTAVVILQSQQLLPMKIWYVLVDCCCSPKMVAVTTTFENWYLNFLEPHFFRYHFWAFRLCSPQGRQKQYHTCLLFSAELLHHNCHHQSNDTPLTARNSKWSMWTRSTTHNNNTHRTCLGTRTPQNKLAGTGPDPSRSLTVSLLQTGAENVQLKAAGAETRLWPTPAKKIRLFQLCVVSNLLYEVPGFKQGAIVPSFVPHLPTSVAFRMRQCYRESQTRASEVIIYNGYGNCLWLRYVRWCTSGIWRSAIFFLGQQRHGLTRR